MIDNFKISKNQTAMAPPQPAKNQTAMPTLPDGFSEYVNSGYKIKMKNVDAT
jgi:hypothetical protein